MPQTSWQLQGWTPICPLTNSLTSVHIHMWSHQGLSRFPQWNYKVSEGLERTIYALSVREHFCPLMESHYPRFIVLWHQTQGYLGKSGNVCASRHWHYLYWWTKCITYCLLQAFISTESHLSQEPSRETYCKPDQHRRHSWLEIQIWPAPI